MILVYATSPGVLLGFFLYDNGTDDEHQHDGENGNGDVYSDANGGH